ncbi:MAG: prepilin-type N-terminal cleavage/methylation domain-containing protein [Verrucomicrobiota bacterium]
MKYRNTPSRRDGFTLIELLTVVAIIGILAGILIPAVGGAKKSALKTQSRAQFSGWATALEQYKAEYGHYPTIGSLSTGGTLNLNTNGEEFVKALSARDVDGRSLSDADRRRLNRKGISFYSFGDAELTDENGDLDDSGRLYDAFGNSNIFVKVDHDNNGIVPKSGFPSDAGNDDLRGRVAIWTDETNSTIEDGVTIMSWK